MSDARASGRVIAVVGPTAAGKTRLADDLAAHLGGEVVTADSMQVYRGMDIGTAKPTASERTVPHHCIDLVDPGVPFSAAMYQQAARTVIDTLLARDVTPVIAGGTGLYVRAALDDMSFPAGESDSPVRRSLEARARQIGPSAMHEILERSDPESAALIHPNNVRRVIRALEMLDEGVSYAAQAAGFGERSSVYSTLFLGLTMSREALYRRIDERVDRMIADGLLDEVASLIERGFRGALTASQAIGYKEFVPVIEGDAALEEAIVQVKISSRRYAKRQLTWFKADSRIRWLDVTDMSAEAVLHTALELLESEEPAAYPAEIGSDDSAGGGSVPVRRRT